MYKPYMRCNNCIHWEVRLNLTPCKICDINIPDKNCFIDKPTIEEKEEKQDV